jgi:hypothetical protein
MRDPEARAIARQAYVLIALSVTLMILGVIQLLSAAGVL